MSNLPKLLLIITDLRDNYVRQLQLCVNQLRSNCNRAESRSWSSRMALPGDKMNFNPDMEQEENPLENRRRRVKMFKFAIIS